MRKLLFLECSPFGFDSTGAQQARIALRQAGEQGHRFEVNECGLALDAFQPVSRTYAQAITSRAPFEDPAFAHSEKLIRDVEACDALLISTPMHNFTVPATLKLWIDHVLRSSRTFTITLEGKFGLLKDRPTFVLVRSGGACVGEDARQPDFLTDYLRHALSVMGIRNVAFAYLPGPNPTPEMLGAVQGALASFLVRP